MNIYDKETICAISTPAGIGGIAIIRVSGDDAIAVVDKIWQGKSLSKVDSHTAHLGRIVDSDGSVLDETVATIFRNPASFTGEDVVEISCHGSRYIQQRLLQLLLQNGCRMATAGEFSQRAFLNHKMDLSQTEAIADLIASTSKAAHHLAYSQMKGGFSSQLAQLREKLLQFCSLLELELDFSEEDVTFADREQLLLLAENIHTTLLRLINSFSLGNAIKNGIPVAIVGETNVGKSTLLNALLQEDKALVSDIHGTTRDVIEDTIVIKGTLYRLIDTAGIRKTDDEIENMGIQRTFDRLNKAQLVLWVIDPTAENALELYPEISRHTSDKSLLVIVNKKDLLSDSCRYALEKSLCSLSIAQGDIFYISAATSDGLDELTNRLVQLASTTDGSDVIVTNVRHYQALKRADEAVIRALDGLQGQLSGDLIAQDVRECLHFLGEITGEITSQDILTNIFSHFCIGK